RDTGERIGDRDGVPIIAQHQHRYLFAAERIVHPADRKRRDPVHTLLLEDACDAGRHIDRHGSILPHSGASFAVTVSLHIRTTAETVEPRSRGWGLPQHRSIGSGGAGVAISFLGRGASKRGREPSRWRVVRAGRARLFGDGADQHVEIEWSTNADAP